MYNDETDRFEIPEDYDDAQLQDDIMGILAGWYSPEDTALNPEGSEIHTFQQEGVLTYNKGLVIKLPNGSEFQLTIVQSR